MIETYDVSAGLFIRGLTNLKLLLKKAEEHAQATGSAAALLNARLTAEETEGANTGFAPSDVHQYTLSAQVHWAAEGARLAMTHLLGIQRAKVPSQEASFADLHRCIDETIAFLQQINPNDLQAGLDRAIVIEHPRGAMRSTGAQFLIAFAIPHFFYHVTATYSILRNHGVPLRMGDFLGNWTS